MGRLNFLDMANKKQRVLIDEIEETSPEFLEATRMFFRGKLHDLEKQLKKTEDNLVITQAAANYHKKKKDYWKNKYHVLNNKLKENGKNI